MQSTTTDAIRKSVTVATPIEHAFHVFTEGIGSWWPVRTHSMGQEKTEQAVFEPTAGGRIYERQADGTEVEWGTVQTWEPPRRVVFSWGLNGSEIEVRFVPEGSDTRVELEHRGWDRLEDEQGRESYDEGWDVVLAEYVRAAAA